MGSSDCRYYEDYYTLKGLIERCRFSEQFIRDVQKHGLMLPEIVRFGSEEIEIYSNLDRHIGDLIKKSREKSMGFSEAIIAAQAHIVEVYRVAHGTTSTGMEDPESAADFPSTQRRKKLFVLSELLEALGIPEETFREIGKHMELVPMRLLIPGRVIEYYFDDDYLKLRYILTLIDQGCPGQVAVNVAYDWHMCELSYL